MESILHVIKSAAFAGMVYAFGDAFVAYDGEARPFAIAAVCAFIYKGLDVEWEHENVS